MDQVVGYAPGRSPKQATYRGKHPQARGVSGVVQTNAFALGESHVSKQWRTGASRRWWVCRAESVREVQGRGSNGDDVWTQSALPHATSHYKHLGIHTFLMPPSRRHRNQHTHTLSTTNLALRSRLRIQKFAATFKITLLRT